MNEISKYFKDPKTKLDKNAEIIFQYYLNGFSLYQNKNYANALKSLRKFLNEIKILKDDSEFLTHTWAEFITFKESECIKLIKSIELHTKKSDDLDILDLCPKPPKHDPKIVSTNHNSTKVFKEGHQSEFHNKQKDISTNITYSFKTEDYTIHPLKNKYETMDSTSLNESIKDADILIIEIRAKNLYDSFRVISANSVCLEPPKCDQFFTFIENLDKIIRDASCNTNFKKIIIIFDEQKNINNSQLHFIPFSNLPSSKNHIDFLLRLFDICTFYINSIPLYILSVPFEIFKKTYPLSCIHYSMGCSLERTRKNYLSQTPLEFPTQASIIPKHKLQNDFPTLTISDSHKKEIFPCIQPPTLSDANDSINQNVILNYFKSSPKPQISPSKQENIKESEAITKIVPTIEDMNKEQHLNEPVSKISASEQSIERIQPIISLKNNQPPSILSSNESLPKIKHYDAPNTPSSTNNVKDSNINNNSSFKGTPSKFNKINQYPQTSIPNTPKTQQSPLNLNPENNKPILPVSPEKLNYDIQQKSSRTEQTVIKPVSTRENFTSVPIVSNDVKTKIEKPSPLDNKINISNQNNETQPNIDQNINFQVKINQPAVNACNLESKLPKVTIPTEPLKPKFNTEPITPIVPLKTVTEIPTVDRSTKPVIQSYTNDCPKNYQDAYIPVRSTSEPYMVGLDNPNNICYINSVLQSLFSINSFCELVKRANFIINLNMPRDQTIPTLIPQLYILLAEIRAGRYTFLSMQSIQDVIFSRVLYLTRGYQQDAHEFLMAFLNILEEDIKIISNFESIEKNSTIISVKLQDKTILQSFNDLFYGQIQSRICCRTCGYNTSTFEKFTCLSLPLCSKNGEEIKSPTVEACLKNYFIQETLPLAYGWKCEKCREVREALKDQIVEKLPVVLMLHLLRNSADGTKINTFVSYPVHKLRFNFPFSLDVVKKLPNSLEFNLHSVVHHHGETIRSGHYTANCKRLLGGNPSKLEWITFDDRRAEKMWNHDDVVKVSCYLLFYYSKSEN